MLIVGFEGNDEFEKFGKWNKFVSENCLEGG